jgi:hypothetical protein
MKFLETFMPFCEESSDEYVIPEYSENPDITFQRALDLMKHCEQNPKDSNRIYWHNSEATQPRHAMVFYTFDGACILGLSVDDEQIETDFLEKLKKFSNSNFGYITYESPPEDTREDFIAVVKFLEKI